jgi:hypothetical protein
MTQAETCSHGKNVFCVWLRICPSPFIVLRRAELQGVAFKFFWEEWGQIYRGADKSLARPGRKRLTGHLQPRRNWPTWASNVLITHPILRIWPRRTTTCSLDWKRQPKREVGRQIFLRRLGKITQILIQNKRCLPEIWTIHLQNVTSEALPLQNNEVWYWDSNSLPSVPLFDTESLSFIIPTLTQV